MKTIGNEKNISFGKGISRTLIIVFMIVISSFLMSGCGKVEIIEGVDVIRLGTTPFYKQVIIFCSLLFVSLLSLFVILDIIRNEFAWPEFISSFELTVKGIFPLFALLMGVITFFSLPIQKCIIDNETISFKDIHIGWHSLIKVEVICKRYSTRITGLKRPGSRNIRSGYTCNLVFSSHDGKVIEVYLNSSGDGMRWIRPMNKVEYDKISNFIEKRKPGVLIPITAGKAERAFRYEESN